MLKALLAGAFVLTVAAACGQTPNAAPETPSPVPPTNAETTTGLPSPTPTQAESPTRLPPATPSSAELPSPVPTLTPFATEPPSPMPTPTPSATEPPPPTPTPTPSATALPSPTSTRTGTPSTATPVGDHEPPAGEPMVGAGVGDLAPAFELASASGASRSIEAYRGDKNLVVVFYRAFW